ncbi:MAG: HAMP domain-containing sensor histidine kinase [Candidatus Dojkabacteria bacterium]
MKIFQTLTFKITLGIVFITSVILISISLFAFTTAQSEFQSASSRLVTSPDGSVFLVKQPPIVDSIRKDFNDNLENSIATGGIVGISIALVLGLFFSLIITKPIEKLKEGISHLRNSRYKYKIEDTGEVEIDDVIEEFNKLTLELSAQEELRKDLISDVSHELKTPITSIIGQIQGLRDKVLSLDDQRLELIQKDAERLANLVSLLQEYTKLRSKTLNLKLEEVNLFEIIEHISKSHESDLKKKKITLNNKISKDEMIKADKATLERIVENIVDNSIKYSRAKNIDIAYENNKIIISDDGVGIPEEDLTKIFERFYRVEKSRNRNTGGLGLGLALVKEMVEVHGWNIKAINNRDKGVRFEIIL